MAAPPLLAVPLEFEVWSLGFKVWGLRDGVWIWGLVFGVEGMGCGSRIRFQVAVSGLQILGFRV